MKYKLINTKTNQETLCDKVTIKGFEYYVSEEAKIKADNLWVVSKRTKYLGKTFYPKNDGTVTDDVIKELLLSVKYEGHYETTVGRGGDCDLVIACNNPNIDIPKLIDEVERLALQHNDYSAQKPSITYDREGYFNVKNYIDGYNQSQYTHPFSEEDMIEFATYMLYNARPLPLKQQLDEWKAQQSKTIYYESN